MSITYYNWEITMRKTSGTVTYHWVTPNHCYRYEIALFPVPHSAFHCFKKKSRRRPSKFSDVTMIAISHRDEIVCWSTYYAFYTWELPDSLIPSPSKNTERMPVPFFHVIDVSVYLDRQKGEGSLIEIMHSAHSFWTRSDSMFFALRAFRQNSSTWSR